MDKLTTFLFDLDGTLLPMDNDAFTKAYFGALVKRIAPLGFEPQKLIDSIWGGTKAMVKNDGSCPNETAFWNYFQGVWGEDSLKYIPEFDDFYKKEFLSAKAATAPTELAGKCVAQLKKKGYTVALATNPIFPKVATDARMAWAGLDAADFALVTTYENIGYCKPNPEYYAEILRRIGKTAAECVMVGNDVDEDLCAEKLGMRTILVPDYLINRTGKDISGYDCKSMQELYEYICSLPVVE